MFSIRTQVATALALAFIFAGCSAPGAGTNDGASSEDAAIIARPAVESVTTFDPAAGGLPEGLAVRGNTAYVGMAPTGEIRTVDLQSGVSRSFATLPHPVPNSGLFEAVEA